MLSMLFDVALGSVRKWVTPVAPEMLRSIICVEPFVFLARYDFRKRVANVLEVHMSRVSILPGALSPTAGGRCQQVTFLVSGKTERFAFDHLTPVQRGHESCLF